MDMVFFRAVIEPWLPYGDIAACNVADQRHDPEGQGADPGVPPGTRDERDGGRPAADHTRSRPRPPEPPWGNARISNA